MAQFHFTKHLLLYKAKLIDLLVIVMREQGSIEIWRIVIFVDRKYSRLTPIIPVIQPRNSLTSSLILVIQPRNSLTSSLIPVIQPRNSLTSSLIPVIQPRNSLTSSILHLLTCIPTYFDMLYKVTSYVDWPDFCSNSFVSVGNPWCMSVNLFMNVYYTADILPDIVQNLIHRIDPRLSICCFEW